MSTLEKQRQTLDQMVTFASESADTKVDKIIDLIDNDEPVWILAAGKASQKMVLSLENSLGNRIRDGILISNQPPNPEITYVQQFKASHPYPDESCWSASLELLELAREIPAGETVIFCISGGASSLLCIPAGELEINELAYIYKILLNSGAPIHHMNMIRKHLSAIKGGQLASALVHTKLITLAISDVPGDDPEVIGSGPTLPDSTTFEDVYRISKYHGIWDKYPVSVRKHLLDGLEGLIPDTPKPGEDEHPNHHIEMISTARLLAEQCANNLERQGYHAHIDNKAYSEDTRKVSKRMCAEAISVLSKDNPVEKPAALLYYGESTVNVTGDGKGGRNQELALATAISLEGQHAISMMSFATDGVDGPTDAAGAIINSKTTLNARKRGLDPETFLQNNDSYSFFKETGELIKTGPTGNNLMDLQILLVEKNGS